MVSSATAMSGCTSNAVVCAPRSPTSSWVVATATISAVLCFMARSASSMTKTPTRSSRRFAHHTVPDLFELAVERDDVAELDLSAHPLDRQAEVNEQLLHLGRFDLVPIEHMDRLGSRLQRPAQDGSGEPVDEHPLRNQGAGVEAADRLQAEEPVVVDMGDEKPDLVHVSGEHDPRTIATPGSDHTAQGVNPQLIDERSQLLDHDRPHPLLAPGNPRCRAEPLQQFEIHRIRHVASRPSGAPAIRHRCDHGRQGGSVAVAPTPDPISRVSQRAAPVMGRPGVESGDHSLLLS